MVTIISAVQSEDSGISKLSKSVLNAVEQKETAIRDSIQESMAPNSPLTTMPEPVLDFLARIEQGIKTPGERATFENYKAALYKSHQYNVDYLNERVDAKSANANIKFALSALQKTTSAIQQILSAQ